MFNTKKVINNIMGDNHSRNNEIFNNDVSLVQDFDSRVQEKNLVQLERKLATIYQSARGKDYGWGGIAKQDPDKFRMALSIAKNNIYVMR